MNIRRYTLTGALSGILAGGCALMDQQAPPAGSGPALSAEQVYQLVAQLTWADPQKGQDIADALLQGGPAGIRVVTDMLTPPEDSSDANARFALEALVLRVQRRGAEQRRAMVSDTLTQALAQANDSEIKTFLIQRLQLVGGAEAAPVLAAYLGDRELCEPATQALLAIGGPGAADAIRTQLPHAEGPCLLTLVQALGTLADKEAISLLRPHADNPENTLRHAALYALSRCGDREIIPRLQAAATSPSTYEASLARRNLLVLAKALAEEGDPDSAITLCREFLAQESAPIASAGLATLVSIQGKAALPELLAVMDRESAQLRESALDLALKMPGKAVTDAWITKAATVAPEARAAIVRMLGRRQDPRAWDSVHGALGAPDAPVRQAAMHALARLDAAAALPILVEVAAQGEDDDVTGAREVLRQVGSETFGATLAQALPTAHSSGKTALIELLAERGAAAQVDAVFAEVANPDSSVRKAAFSALESLAGGNELQRLLGVMLSTESSADRKGAQNVIVAVVKREPQLAPDVVTALDAATGAEAQAVLLQTLARIGGDAPRDAVLAALPSAEPQVRDAAVRALADWPDATVIATLTNLITRTDSPVHRVLALRGVVRLASLPGSGSAEVRVGFFEQAMRLAQSAPEQKLVLGGLGGLRHERALSIAVAALDNADLRQESAAAVVGIACPRDKNDRGMQTESAYRALRKVVGFDVGKELRDKAEAQAQALTPLVSGNLALGKPVTSSCKHQGNRVVSQAVDGRLTRDAAYFGAVWPSTLTVDLEKTSRIDTVRVIFYWDGRRFYTYTVDVSVDGTTWKTVADNGANTTPADSQGIVHRFAPVEARYVRLNILKNSVNEAVHVVEFEVYAAGKSPETFSSAEPPALPVPPLPEADAEGFISLFNGKDLSGWIGSLGGYEVVDGVLRCKKTGGGRLFSAYRFSDFILRFEFRLTPGANNGLAIRSPGSGNPAYVGMELQIIDNPGYETVHNYKLKPTQVHGSIYGLVPAKTGALKPVGEWNRQEVRAVGSRIMVILNEQTIVDANLDEVARTTPADVIKKHPGLFRRNGHIGWLGHGAEVDFRHIRIKPLEPYTEGPHNLPPEGYTALFNGKDLGGWKGLVANPEKRARMSAAELAVAQESADQEMRLHWQVVDGTLVFDGKGKSLCTARDYADFDMYVDSKIEPKGDSGIYLRGSPQVQIWDPQAHPEGSGGLYNNKKHPAKPSECMDHPVGQWNRFRIRMIGERVWVWLNGVLVVDNVVMENYWNRDVPIYPSGQIELQNHGNTLYFRNIYLREISPAEAAAGN